MKKFSLLIILTLTVFALSACPPRKVVQPTPSDTLPSQQTPTDTSFRQTGISEQKMPEIKQPERITETQIAKIETVDDKSKVHFKEVTDMFEDIYFNYDEYVLQPEGKTILENVSNWMLKNKNTVISLEGHCDERGTNEYNLALGDKRAKSARDYLVALGIPSERLQTISYGEEKPVCTEKTESCWAKNRRVHIVVLKEK